MSIKAGMMSLIACLAISGISIAATISEEYEYEKAQSRLKSAMKNVQDDAKNPQISVGREQVSIPNDVGTVKHRMPNFEDYGVQKDIDSNPMAVAKRCKMRLSSNVKQHKTDLLVFVSFSMPQASLLRIAHEAKKTGAVLVIRGFKDSSLKKTVTATEKIAAMGADLLIHPDLFDEYRIVEVPTFVLAKNDGDTSSCSGKNQGCTSSFQVKGDVSLYAVLDHFIEQKGDDALKEEASYRLAKLEGLK